MFYKSITKCTYCPEYDVYEPVYGTENSVPLKRLNPTQFTVDTPPPSIRQILYSIFLDAINVLDINNLFGYTYSRYYSEREEIQSYFWGRMVVVGVEVILWLGIRFVYDFNSLVLQSVSELKSSSMICYVFILR